MSKAKHAESRETHTKRSEKKRRQDKSSGQEPKVKEIGGPPGPEPTRYGDWEKGGRCVDF